MKRLILFFLSAFVVFTASAQAPKEYTDNIEQAEKYYDSKDYRRSAEYYSKAFLAMDGKGYIDDLYNAACSWALAGDADSAFRKLERIASQYQDLGHITSDRDLLTLHSDPRWEKVIAQVKANKEKAEEGLNKPLAHMLDTIYTEDQSYRMQIEGIEKKYGRDSKEMRAHWKIIAEKDSVNLLKVVAILDKYGWLGPKEVGPQGSQTLFLVIQHADITTQKKYLPMMREAVKAGKAQASALALLEDRVALREGRKQIYGSQIGRNDDGSYYVSALEDPDNVDKRRKEMGLGPLANYVRSWDIKWDVEDYKKQLPELEKKLEKE